MTASPPTSAVRDRLLAVALAVGLLAAYFPVFLYSPGQAEPNGPVEGFFFRPSNTSPALIYGLIALFLWGRRHRIRDALAGAPASASRMRWRRPHRKSAINP